MLHSHFCLKNVEKPCGEESTRLLIDDYNNNMANAFGACGDYDNATIHIIVLENRAYAIYKDQVQLYSHGIRYI